MKLPVSTNHALPLLLVITMALSGCGGTKSPKGEGAEKADETHYIVAVEDEPDTVDFQCTTIHYTIAQNVFDRLVEMENDLEGGAKVLPSLAESWDVSEDHCTYTFHLREGVTFSNGSPLTSSDVLYTFTRLLTCPDACNQDILYAVQGARELEAGEESTLTGFEILDERSFRVHLDKPFEAFLACLSTPGASILDEETTREGGDRFGKEVSCTIGTGSFILKSWVPGKEMILVRNPLCFRGMSAGEGLRLVFLNDAVQIQELFDKGEMDVLNLDEVGNAAEYYLHGDIYQDGLYPVQLISIAYVALNESNPYLSDVRVRRALLMALDRDILLDVTYGGRGVIEHGVMPHGLYGFNEDLPPISFDREEAKRLLREGGYPEGFTLPFSVSSSTTLGEMDLIRAISSMWEEIGVKVELAVCSAEEFLSQRKSGNLACYLGSWLADYDDPDNFFYTFFGNKENTRYRSLCYPREEVMERVEKARSIRDPEERIREYQELERIIVQEDVAWIPLFSRFRYYVTAGRLGGMKASWNGSVKNEYRQMFVR